MKDSKPSYRILIHLGPGCNEVYRKLYGWWHDSHPAFHRAYSEVVEHNARVSWGKFLSAMGSILLCTFIGAFVLVHPLGLFGSVFFHAAAIVGLVMFGYGIGLIIHCKPDWTDEREVQQFADAIVAVLWPLVEYRTRSRCLFFPEDTIKGILGGVDVGVLRKEVDSMLVHLAFKVRKLEDVSHEGDVELLQVREKFRVVHSNAVALHLAEKNPRTYFERAVPAANHVAQEVSA